MLAQERNSLYHTMGRVVARRPEGPPDTTLTRAVETIDNDCAVEWLLGSALIE
jgi:hypothetical protein